MQAGAGGMASAAVGTGLRRQVLKARTSSPAGIGAVAATRAVESASKSTAAFGAQEWFRHETNCAPPTRLAQHAVIGLHHGRAASRGGGCMMEPKR